MSVARDTIPRLQHHRASGQAHVRQIGTGLAAPVAPAH
jgi:hypothetical protein